MVNVYAFDFSGLAFDYVCMNQNSVTHRIQNGGAWLVERSDITALMTGLQDFDEIVAALSKSHTHRLLIWDIRTLENTGMVVGPRVCGDTVDVKGNYILGGSYEPKDGVLLYDDRKFTEPIKSFKIDSHIYCCKFNKRENDFIFAAGGYKRNLMKVFDINKNDYLFGLEGIGSACYALDFSLGGTVLAYGCADGALRIVDI